MDPNSFNSESEFQETYKNKTWVVGTRRGKTYVEILKSAGCQLNHKTVLDLGSGYGGTSLVFSENSAETIGLDITKDLLVVAKRRAEISQSRFHPLHASGNMIPLRDNSMDIVIMMGVLEFIPRCEPAVDPESTHVKVLLEIKRVLKKDGVLLIGMENRYWIGFWLGKRDHHTNLRFVTVVPRAIANYICRRFKGSSYYLERTYSFSGLTKILKKTGFEVLKRFTGLPSWDQSSMFADIDDAEEVSKMLDAIEPWKPRVHGHYDLSFLPKVFWKLLVPFGLVKLFCSNFIYLCRV